MDDISIIRLNQLHPLIRQSALDAYNEAVTATPPGIHPFVTQTLRTFEESDRLYAQGRTSLGKIVSNSKAGQSYHNYGLALDFALMINGAIVWDVNENWMTVVNVFKKHGFTWGGDFINLKDYPHLENKLGYNWRDLLKMHEDKKFIPGTEYLKL